MKKLPLGIQSFRKLIDGGYVYVDKTRYVYDLINDASYYFLSRPRRFGKSLLLDTIAEAFSGDRELFKGLWIYESDYEFKKHPVIHIDMSNIANKTPEILENELLSELRKLTNAEGLEIDYGTPSSVFKTLIEELHKKHDQRVVVLIDEYDKPILDHLHDTMIAEANRIVIRGFYGVLKSMDPHLKMTFITGVSKFTRTSIFSEMNNLLDITMIKEYSSICGVPVEELRKYFGEHIENLASYDYFKRYSCLHDKILEWYDGYSWDGDARVINPFGLLSFFLSKKFSGFWYASGSPKFLMDMIKERPELYVNLNNLRIGEWAMDTFDVHSMQAAPLLFQTGYLTVKEIIYTLDTPTYLLDIPNLEVREAFNMHILVELTEKGPADVESAYRRIYEALYTGDLRGILNILRGLFASIPYELHIKHESYYHSIFYAIMNLLGFDIEAEASVSGGRVDAVLELGDKVYVVEFKYEHCARDASPEEKRKLFDKALDEGLEQIMNRGYAKKYEGSGKTVYQAAFAFLGRDDIELRQS